MTISTHDLEMTFPNLKQEGYKLTSPFDISYNCIAWSTGANDLWWWPEGYYWPDNLSRAVTVEAFVALYNSLGYEECDTDTMEVGYEKIALYANKNNEPTHAARQLSTGKWTSKLGRAEDIEHTLNGIVNDSYGAVVKIFKRKN